MIDYILYAGGQNMIYFMAFIASLTAGIIQGLTGFGAGIVIMSLLPYAAGITKSAAIAPVISAVLLVSMVWMYRDALRWKLVVLPTVFYLFGSALAIMTVRYIDVSLLKMVFGVFLIALALYFFFAKEIRLKNTMITMFLCGFGSGLCDGFFSAGGPLMVLYYSALTDNRREYMANLQFVFLAAAVFNTFLRVKNGIFTSDLILPALLGMIGILAGLKLAGKLSVKEKTAKTLTCLLIAVSGVITLSSVLFG